VTISSSHLGAAGDAVRWCGDAAPVKADEITWSVIAMITWQAGKQR
jgi:hypothetical protein